MRLAPPVAVDSDTGLGWRVLQSVLAGGAGAHLAAWGGAWAEWPTAPSAALAAVAASAASAFAWWASRTEPAHLVWDGERWTLGPEAREGHPELMIDFGRWFLLRFRFASGRPAVRWLAVSAAQAGGAWRPLRAAVYCAPFQPTHRVRSPERQPD